MSRITPYLLWAALVATLLGTLANTTWAFATVNGGNLLWGGVQAIAADLGLVALAATLAERRAQGERAGWLWCAVAGFVAVSTYASYLHSYAQATPLDAPLSALRPALLGAFLPLMLFALVEVVSHARRSMRTERAQSEQASYNAPPAAQEGKGATQSDAYVPQVVYAPPPPAPTTNGHKEPCERCGTPIGASQQARAAHKRFCVAQQESA